MLVLKRRTNERIRLRLNGVDVWVTVVETTSGAARLAFEAPPEVQIDREEILPYEDEYRQSWAAKKLPPAADIIRPVLPRGDC